MTSEGALYGQSLYDLAKEEQITDRLLEELEMVGSLFSENTDYITLLLEPSIPRKERLGLVDDAFRGQVHSYVLNLLKLMLENNLLREFNACVRQYRASYNEDNGIAEAVVTSAVPLTDGEVEQLTAKLEQFTGKKILLTQKVDETVLGGLCVETDGKRLDGTVTGKLDDMRRMLSDIVL